MFKLKPADPLQIAVSDSLTPMESPSSFVGCSRKNTHLFVKSMVPVLFMVPAGALFAADTGDAPISYGIAVHEIPAVPPYIGVIPPDDDNAIPGVNADSDDLDGVDDEDGVFAFPTLVQNSKAYDTNVFVSNPTNQVANLVGWVDFNGNGIFEPEEAAVATVQPGADNEKIKLIWPDLDGITTDYQGTTYARFRISSDVITPFDATGTAQDGEVEDYALTIQSDVDGDEIPDSEDLDNDNDGIPDLVEGLTIDTDNDGTLNYLDVDSDNDQLPDAFEAGANPLNPVDTDADGAPDYIDIDSDNDGVLDSDVITSDVDGDGIIGEIEGLGDADGDGIANLYDLDSDNDSIPDRIETILDSDGDTIPNYFDLDSDNDGIPDIREGSLGNRDIDADALDLDADGQIDIGNVFGSNGLIDFAESAADSGELNFTIVDSDSDGANDYLDTDSDNDTVSDLIEAGGVDADNDGIVDSLLDSDADGVVDSVDIDFVTNGFDADSDDIVDSADASFSDAVDTDNDGIIDSEDPDADGNGLVDQAINLMTTGGVLPDSDGDGIPDYQDAIDGQNPDDTNGNGDQVPVVVTTVSEIETGLSGNGVSGCAIPNPELAGAGRGSLDPLLAGLALISAFLLGLRNRMRKFQARKVKISR